MEVIFPLAAMQQFENKNLHLREENFRRYLGDLHFPRVYSAARRFHSFCKCRDLRGTKCGCWWQFIKGSFFQINLCSALKTDINLNIISSCLTLAPIRGQKERNTSTETKQTR